MCSSFHCHCLRLQTKRNTLYFILPGEGRDVAVQKSTENILRFFCHELVIISNCRCFYIVDCYMCANSNKKAAYCCVSIAAVVTRTRRNVTFYVRYLVKVMIMVLIM
jgi:hypothetical protein